MQYFNEKSCTTLYYQLKNIFMNKIRKKEWKAGEKIPNEFDLCHQYNVSRITVRQALTELQREGYIIRKQGKGTFVSIPKIEQNLTSFYSFSKEFKKRGFIPETKVLEFHIQLPDAETGKILGLDREKSQVYYIKRVRYADDIVMAIESTYIPVHMFPGIQEKELEDKPIYDIMRDKYGIVPDTAEECFGAVLISERDSIYFQIKAGSPALHLERFTYSREVSIEYTKSIVRGDIFNFRVKLH